MTDFFHLEPSESPVARKCAQATLLAQATFLRVFFLLLLSIYRLFTFCETSAVYRK